jgi:hypothetical protein
VTLNFVFTSSTVVHDSNVLCLHLQRTKLAESQNVSCFGALPMRRYIEMNFWYVNGFSFRLSLDL